MALTADQREVWELTKPHEYEPSGDQELEHARNLAVADYQAVCELEGVPVPTAEEVEAELDRRRAA